MDIVMVSCIMGHESPSFPLTHSTPAASLFFSLFLSRSHTHACTDAHMHANTQVKGGQFLNCRSWTNYRAYLFYIISRMMLNTKMYFNLGSVMGNTGKKMFLYKRFIFKFWNVFYFCKIKKGNTGRVYFVPETFSYSLLRALWGQCLRFKAAVLSEPSIHTHSVITQNLNGP